MLLGYYISPIVYANFRGQTKSIMGHAFENIELSVFRDLTEIRVHLTRGLPGHNI